ncbi:plasmid pRiA4b ORF-3 family protein [Actinomadura hibisca]|uniref:plasmid pRiA4b ORF-3 family protein n=1 Tax=Actinomadura hibisca TaxID=68565 RepID=UPI00083754AB|nr:plasmid pRiA4b ORF-3 family protein [Actinomadura hibisca]
MQSSRAHRLTITLLDVEPPVQRTIEVPGPTTLGELHTIVQAAMGWENAHLHAFETDGHRYGTPGLELGFADENHITVAEALPRKDSRLIYEYDFGDGWRHEIKTEEIRGTTPDTELPRVIAGTGACPPEDCGGPWGYADLLEVLSDPTHPDHADRLEWTGGPIDPKAFDLTETAARLRD